MSPASNFALGQLEGPQHLASWSNCMKIGWKHMQVWFSLISHVKNYCCGKCKNLSTTVFKILGEISTKITAVKMVNALCLLLALDSELGRSDIQLDAAGISCFHEMRQIQGNLKNFRLCGTLCGNLNQKTTTASSSIILSLQKLSHLCYASLNSRPAAELI